MPFDSKHTQPNYKYTYFPIDRQFQSFIGYRPLTFSNANSCPVIAYSPRFSLCGLTCSNLLGHSFLNALQLLFNLFIYLINISKIFFAQCQTQADKRLNQFTLFINQIILIVHFVQKINEIYIFVCF